MVTEPWSPDQQDRDMIVPLLALPGSEQALHRVLVQDIRVFRATMGELTPLRTFICAHFTQVWADGTQAALAHQPATVFVATERGQIIGFAAHSCNRPDIVGPLGVHPEYRGRGIGAALLFQCLLDLRAAGYVYAIIGQVGPAAFYEKTCGARLLPAEWPHSGTLVHL
jgi:GNAT superfamily N-acetyltransferase